MSGHTAESEGRMSPFKDSEMRLRVRLKQDFLRMLTILAEFVADVRAAYPGKQLAREWPDLYITYQKALAVVGKERKKR